MKTNARKSSTPFSGQLSVSNYTKKLAAYNRFKIQGKNKEAYQILVYLRGRFNDLDNQGTSYWQSTKKKNSHFKPLEQRLIDEMRQLGEKNLYPNPVKPRQLS